MAAHLGFGQQQQPQDFQDYVAAGIDEEDKEWENDGAFGRFLEQRTPEEPQRLEIFSVICIISNRMIGKQLLYGHMSATFTNVRM